LAVLGRERSKWTSAVVAGTGALGRPHWSLDDVESYLNGER